MSADMLRAFLLNYQEGQWGEQEKLTGAVVMGPPMADLVKYWDQFKETWNQEQKRATYPQDKLLALFADWLVRNKVGFQHVSHAAFFKDQNNDMFYGSME